MTDTRFKKGHVMSAEMKQKISETRKRNGIKPIVKFGEEAPNWKGDKAEYRAIHSWVNKKFGKIQKCERCGSTKKQRYEWSNNKPELTRDRENWERLCIKCHRRKDKWFEKVGIKGATRNLIRKEIHG